VLQKKKNQQRKEEPAVKRGVIIYTAGEAPASWTEEQEKLVKKSVVGAEAVEIITTKTGHFDILDAWWSLKTRGMAHIECKMAIFTKDGELKETGSALRLCG
jgi:hypothetical protein